MSSRNPLTPLNINDKSEELEMSSFPASSNILPKMKFDDVRVTLSTMTNAFLEQTEFENPYKIILVEYTKYQKTMNFKTFKENVKKRLSLQDLNILSHKGLFLLNLEMPILNYFAYFLECDILGFLFELFAKVSIEIFPDSYNRDVLEIVLEFKNHNMIELIIKETSKNAPHYRCWKNLSRNTIKKLFNLKIDKMGTFLDSRVFTIQTDWKLMISSHFNLFKSVVQMSINGMKTCFFLVDSSLWHIFAIKYW